MIWSEILPEKRIVWHILLSTRPSSVPHGCHWTIRMKHPTMSLLVEQQISFAQRIWQLALTSLWMFDRQKYEYFSTQMYLQYHQGRDSTDKLTLQTMHVTFHMRFHIPKSQWLSKCLLIRSIPRTRRIQYDVKLVLPNRVWIQSKFSCTN